MLHNVDEMNCSLLETNRELTDQLNELRVKQTNIDVITGVIFFVITRRVRTNDTSYNLCGA